MTVVAEDVLLEVGSKAPVFEGVMASGSKRIGLKDYKGRFVILVFYPKDQTPGCTQQLCALRDDYPALKAINTDVLGVNPDSMESHQKFIEKQNDEECCGQVESSIFTAKF